MPVVAVAAAASSFAAGAAAFTAATSIGTMIAAGATLVGSALTIVGTVTGNSKLAKIGGILSIGGMAATALSNASSAASSTASSASSAADAASTAGTAAEAAADVAASGASAMGEAAALEAGASGAASVAPEAAQVAGRGVIDMQPTAQAGAMADIQSQAAVDASSAAQSAASASEPFKVNASNPFQTNADPLSALNQKNILDQQVFNANGKLNLSTGMPSGLIDKYGAMRSIGPSATQSTLGGYFDKFGNWVKENPQLAKMGAEFAGGLFPSEKDKAMTEAYKQQTAEARRRALWAQGKLA